MAHEGVTHAAPRFGLRAAQERQVLEQRVERVLLCRRGRAEEHALHERVDDALRGDEPGRPGALPERPGDGEAVERDVAVATSDGRVVVVVDVADGDGLTARRGDANRHRLVDVLRLVREGQRHRGRHRAELHADLRAIAAVVVVGLRANRDAVVAGRERAVVRGELAVRVAEEASGVRRWAPDAGAVHDGDGLGLERRRRLGRHVDDRDGRVSTGERARLRRRRAGADVRAELVEPEQELRCRGARLDEVRAEVHAAKETDVLVEAVLHRACPAIGERRRPPPVVAEDGRHLRAQLDEVDEGVVVVGVRRAGPRRVQLRGKLLVGGEPTRHLEPADHTTHTRDGLDLRLGPRGLSLRHVSARVGVRQARDEAAGLVLEVVATAQTVKRVRTVGRDDEEAVRVRGVTGDAALLRAHHERVNVGVVGIDDGLEPNADVVRWVAGKVGRRPTAGAPCTCATPAAGAFRVEAADEPSQPSTSTSTIAHRCRMRTPPFEET